jgi:archaetidylinositol phosphate synthase
MAAITAGTTGDHVRENLGLLARSEKQALLWLAARLPRAVNSDHLSALGLAAMGATGLSFAAFPHTRWAAAGVVVSLAVNWFGDSLDGTLARVRQQQRPRYGFYVDHVIDIAGSALLFAGLACSGLMSPSVALVVLAAYLLVCAESYLATHAAGVFRMSFLGFGPTELRILLAIGALKAAGSPWTSIGTSTPVRLFDIGGLAGTAGLLVAFVASSIRNTRALYKAEPRPVGSIDSRTA